ncbi:MAG: hypothetical protein AAGD28_11060 [Bacteroidota bacterium]
MAYETKKGHYRIDQHTKLCNLEDKLDEASIRYLSERQDVQNLQIALPIGYDNKGIYSAEIWRLMNEQLFAKGKLFRIYSYDICDNFSLDFLEFLPALTHFQLDVKAAKMGGYDKLASLKKLDQFIYANEHESGHDYLTFLSDTITYLSVGGNKKSLSLKAIERFSQLEMLAIGKKSKDLASIEKLNNLKSLSLSSLPLKDLSFLKALDNLQELCLSLGSLSDVESLKSLNLTRLETFRVKGIEDVTFLQSLEKLEDLKIETQPKITQLPDLSKLSQLKQVHFSNLKSLTDFTPFKLIPNLKRFSILDFKHDPDLLIPVLENESLEELNFGASTQKQIKKMELLKEKYGKK